MVHIGFGRKNHAKVSHNPFLSVQGWLLISDL